MSGSTFVPAFVIVDSCFRIRYVSAANGDLKLIIANSAQLQPNVEAFMRALPVMSDEYAPGRVGMLTEYHVLCVVRVVGLEGTMFVLSVEDYLEEHRDCLERTARRHQLTRRETQILSLILDGSTAAEIATMLALSEHTVQGYFKRLLSKTGARNRVSMVAAMFEWNKIRLTAIPTYHERANSERLRLTKPAG